MITQFKGESRKDAITNYFGLDIVEEESFLKYIEQMGYSVDADDDIIENLHEMWEENINE